MPWEDTYHPQAITQRVGGIPAQRWMLEDTARGGKCAQEQGKQRLVAKDRAKALLIYTLGLPCRTQLSHQG